MRQGMEPPEAVTAMKAADDRIKAWAEKTGIKFPYSEYGISCIAPGGYNLVLVLDKIIEKLV